MEGEAAFLEKSRSLREALAVAERESGPLHPETFGRMSELGSHLRSGGQFPEAEMWMLKALQGRREVLGPDDPDTLLSMNNLAGLLRAMGRFGEAELLLLQVLEARKRTQEENHRDTIAAMNNLASLWWDQERYSEAEPLLQKVLKWRGDNLGPASPDTMRAMNNLASCFRMLGKESEAESLLREALRLRSESLGPRAPDTLSSMGNLALVLRDQQKFAEAEDLLREASRLRAEILGHPHPDTLHTRGNLGVVLRMRGNYPEAQLELERVLKDGQALQPSHPTRRHAFLNLALTYAAHQDFSKCASCLRELRSGLLNWVEGELYNTKRAAVRRQFVASQSTFQDVALSVALTVGADSAAAEIAAAAVLNFKGLAVEEEAYLAHLSRQGSEKIQSLAEEIAALHNKMSRSLGADGDGMATLAADLEAKEFELGRLSRGYAQTLQVRGFEARELPGKLAPKTALLEIRQYRPVDFRSGDFGEARWAGIFFAGDGRISMKDLGTVTAVTAAVNDLVDADVPTADRDTAAGILHAQLMAPFEGECAFLECLYVAPDGLLYLVRYPALAKKEAPARNNACAHGPNRARPAARSVGPAGSRPGCGGRRQFRRDRDVLTP